MNRWTTPWPRLMGPQSKCYRVCADYGTWAACLPDRPDQDQQRVRRPGLPEADGAWRRDRFRVPDTELAGRAVRGDTAPGWGPGSTRSNRNPVRLWGGRRLCGLAGLELDELMLSHPQHLLSPRG